MSARASFPRRARPLEVLDLGERRAIAFVMRVFGGRRAARDQFRSSLGTLNRAIAGEGLRRMTASELRHYLRIAHWWAEQVVDRLRADGPTDAAVYDLGLTRRRAERICRDIARGRI